MNAREQTLSIHMPMLPGPGTTISSEVFADDDAADGSSDDYHGVLFLAQFGTA